MGQKTALGSLLKQLATQAEKLYLVGEQFCHDSNWSTTFSFLIILLQIYNQSLLLQGFSVDWNGN